MSGDFNHEATAIRVKGCLVVTLPNDLSSIDPDSLRDTIFSSLENNRSRKLVLDCSGVRFMDSSEFSFLKKIANMVQLQGVKTYMVGLSPWIAAYLAETEADLNGIVAKRGLNDVLGKNG